MVNKYIPRFVKSYIRKNFSIRSYEESVWAKNNPFVNTENEWAFKGKSNFTLGILFDPAHYHRYFQAACIDLNVNYVVIDIRKDNWVEDIKKSNVAGILVWPHLNSSTLKEMFDERLALINDGLKIPVFPEPAGHYLLDNKRRVTDWLKVHGFEQPKSWCFYIKDEAMQFLESTTYPIVHKTVHGSVSKGVKIIETKEEAKQLVTQVFNKGIVPYSWDIRNKQWDFIFFQEYLHECEEKRLIRIGDSYFAIEKIRGNTAYHSGSGKMKWGNPDRIFFDKTKEICEKGNFRSMNVDFFVSKDNRILVNELHSVFHGPQISDEEYRGRHKYDAANDKWIFEAGNFYRNYTTNMRVADFIEHTIKAPVSYDWLKLPVFHEINGLKM